MTPFFILALTLYCIAAFMLVQFDRGKLPAVYVILVFVAAVAAHCLSRYE